MNRAERRRSARAHTRGAIIVRPPGDGVDGFVATGTGHVERARPSAELPPKQPGRHRWVVTAAWIADDQAATEAFDPAKRVMMDNQTLLHIGVVCWDCEQPAGDGRPGTITVGSHCPAPGD